MNYEKYAIDKLRNFGIKVVAVNNLLEEIRELKARQTSLKSSRFDAVCVTGGDSSKAQDAMLNLIAAIDEKTALYKLNHREVERIKRALSVLTEEEYLVLEAFFIYPTADPVKALKEQKHFERTWIYNTRRGALRKFAKALYGAVDT